METVSRPAVRVLCFDADGRVLLLHWRDPHDGALLWEPPGGGIDPGESPLAAARRELYEETGLDPDAIRPPYRDVYRSSMWKGRRFAGDEQFFTAFYPGSRPAISKDNLLEYEVATLIEHRWVHPSELTALPGRLEPPHLAELVEQSRPTALVLPGIGGSGPGHWQTLLEAADPAAARFTPSSWDAPDLADWLAALDRAVGAAGPRPILVAHSLGAVLVAHWAPRAAGRIGGALLVAVPDPAGPGFPAAAATFGPVPHAPLPFPSVLVGSTDDPYDPEALAPRLAAEWGSTYVSLDGAGHINADAGFGPFPLGARLLAELRDGRHAGH